MGSFHPAVRDSALEDNEPPPASPPASFLAPAPKTCPGVLIISLMRVALFNELFAGLGTVTVTPHVPNCGQPRGPGSPSTGTEPSRTQVYGGNGTPVSVGHYGNAGAEQDLGFLLLQAKTCHSSAI